jgi:hypothetical protein
MTDTASGPNTTGDQSIVFGKNEVRMLFMPRTLAAAVERIDRLVQQGWILYAIDVDRAWFRSPSTDIAALPDRCEPQQSQAKP